MDDLERKQAIEDLFMAFQKIPNKGFVRVIIRDTAYIAITELIGAIEWIKRMKMCPPNITQEIKGYHHAKMLEQHNERKFQDIEDSPLSDSKKRFFLLVSKTIMFKRWPEGMTYLLFWQGIIQKWNICQVEDQYLKTVEDAEKMFEEIKES